MRETAKTLEEVLEFADKAKQEGMNGTVYLHQEASAPDNTVIGDEDTGGKAEERIRLVLKTRDGSIYYADEFEDMAFYKEALRQIDKLKTYFPIERTSEENVQEKRRE